MKQIAAPLPSTSSPLLLVSILGLLCGAAAGLVTCVAWGLL
jgi:hypothetical protein